MSLTRSQSPYYKLLTAAIADACRIPELPVVYPVMKRNNIVRIYTRLDYGCCGYVLLLLGSFNHSDTLFVCQFSSSATPDDRIVFITIRYNTITMLLNIFIYFPLLYIHICTHLCKFKCYIIVNMDPEKSIVNRCVFKQ